MLEYRRDYPVVIGASVTSSRTNRGPTLHVAEFPQGSLNDPSTARFTHEAGILKAVASAPDDGDGLYFSGDLRDSAPVDLYLVYDPETQSYRLDRAVPVQMEQVAAPESDAEEPMEVDAIPDPPTLPHMHGAGVARSAQYAMVAAAAAMPSPPPAHDESAQDDVQSVDLNPPVSGEEPAQYEEVPPFFAMQVDPPGEEEEEEYAPADAMETTQEPYPELAEVVPDAPVPDAPVPEQEKPARYPLSLSAMLGGAAGEEEEDSGSESD
ncbi:hypothetical protein BC828DRAFT_414623 [Blastocladiella britannica]|nr:hypothetical protein BC828DRAFT_414623 [Blastocladiella britannica]